MKAVMLSVRPKWCELIANGKKTVEVRKSRPKLETPFKCYIYCTKEKILGELLLTQDGAVEGRNKGFRDKGDKSLSGKVIGEFICDETSIISFEYGGIKEDLEKALAGSCMSNQQARDYLTNNHTKTPKEKELYGWHISGLKIYDEPKDLCFFNRLYTDAESMIYTRPIKRPPQSWCYVEKQEARK